MQASAVLIALGTTRKAAGSAEAFEKIDREYVIKAAEAARVEGKKQRLVYLSVSLVNGRSEARSLKQLGKTKNQTELFSAFLSGRFFQFLLELPLRQIERSASPCSELTTSHMTN